MTAMTTGDTVTAHADQIRDLAGQGHSDPAIGRAIGRSPGYVYKIRAAYGIPAGVQPGIPPLTPERQPLAEAEVHRLRQRLHQQYEQLGQRGYCTDCRTWQPLGRDRRLPAHTRPGVAERCDGSWQTAAPEWL
jgi:hypothetical protein